jgi:predicted metalloprotease with PDZ domain
LHCRSRATGARSPRGLDEAGRPFLELEPRSLAPREQVVREAKPDALSGTKFDAADFFRRYVAGTDELPFAGLLARAGLLLKDQGNLRGYTVEELPHPTDRQRLILDGILHGTTSGTAHAR